MVIIKNIFHIFEAYVSLVFHFYEIHFIILDPYFFNNPNTLSVYYLTGLEIDLF